MINKFQAEHLDTLLTDRESDRKAKQVSGGVAIIVALTIIGIML